MRIDIYLKRTTIVNKDLNINSNNLRHVGGKTV